MLALPPSDIVCYATVAFPSHNEVYVSIATSHFLFQLHELLALIRRSRLKHVSYRHLVKNAYQNFSILNFQPKHML